SRKHPPSAAHVEFESYNAASAAASGPGQIAFVMFEVRDDLVLPLQRHGNINLKRIASDSKFGAREYRRRCEEKNTKQLRPQHLQPKPRDEARTTTNTLLRRRSSRAFLAASRPFGSNREGNSARNKNEHRRR